MTRRNVVRSTFGDHIKFGATTDGDPWYRLWLVNNSIASGVTGGVAYAASVAQYTYGMLDDPGLLSAMFNNIGGAIKTTRLFRLATSISHAMTNTSDSDLHVQEIRLKCKSDMLATKLYQYISTGYTQATTGVGAGLVDGAVQIADATFTLPGDYSPMHNPRMHAYFKVIKNRTLVIKPGQTVTVGYKYRRPLRIDYETILDDANANLDARRGNTFSIFGFGGSFCFNPAAATGKTVAKSAVSCGIITSINTSYTWMNDDDTSYGHLLGLTGAGLASSYGVPHFLVDNFNRNAVVIPTAAVPTANAATSFTLGQVYAGGAPAGDTSELMDAQTE